MDSEWSDEESETDLYESIHELGTDSDDVEPSILCVHGPARAGKSAIMTTLAQ
jgi:hypothetical protein